MGVLQATKYGIKYRQIGRQTWYEVTCAICGELFENISFNSEHVENYICKTCKNNQHAIKDAYLYSKKEQKLEAAIERMEKMVKLKPYYIKAINIVNKNLHNKGWFASTEEIMTAVELLKNNVKAIHQQKINQYRVDFALPDHKIILEIDGPHHKASREGTRDGDIILSMGLDWHIVRISTEKINKSIKQLLPAIIECKKLQIDKLNWHSVWE